MEHTARHDELPVDPDAEIPGATRPLHFRPVLVGAVALGGLFGTLARYVIGRAWPTGSVAFPASTLCINLLGAFVLGALLEALVRRGDDGGWRRSVRLVAGTGFCGGFTTYSTFAVQSDLLVRNGRPATAGAYALLTVLGGAMATVVGIVVAAGDHRRRRRRLPIDPDVVAVGER